MDGHGLRLPPDGELPALDPGLTVLEVPSRRSTALHRVVVDELDRAGRAYWIDTGNAASTHVLHDLAPSRRWLSDLRIARAFTAYQHYTLVREVVRRASPRTGLVVAPNLGALYRDDDVPDHEADAMLGAVVDALSELGAALDLPVLVTDAAPGVGAGRGDSARRRGGTRPDGGARQGDGARRDGGSRSDAGSRRGDGLGDHIRERADAEIRCEETREGYRYVADGFETTVYRAAGYWQTTVPYWVDLCGAVGDWPGWATEALDVEDTAEKLHVEDTGV